MSDPVQNIVTGVRGSNNVFLNCVLNSIGQKFNQPSTPPQETSIWYEMKDPSKLFTGRVKELEELHNMMQQNPCKNKIVLI